MSEFSPHFPAGTRSARRSRALARSRVRKLTFEVLEQRELLNGDLGAAQQAYNDAVAQAAADQQAATQARDAAVAQAQQDLDGVIQQANSAWSASEADAWSAYQDAVGAADSAYWGEVNPAWGDYQQALIDARDEYQAAATDVDNASSSANQSASEAFPLLRMRVFPRSRRGFGKGHPCKRLPGPD